MDFQIKIENYKVLGINGSDQFIDMRPITILTGANDSGKSSFNNALRLFKNTLNTGLFANLNFKHPYIKDSDFDSVKSHKTLIQTNNPNEKENEIHKIIKIEEKPLIEQYIYRDVKGYKFYRNFLFEDEIVFSLKLAEKYIIRFVYQNTWLIKEISIYDENLEYEIFNEIKYRKYLFYVDLVDGVGTLSIDFIDFNKMIEDVFIDNKKGITNFQTYQFISNFTPELKKYFFEKYNVLVEDFEFDISNLLISVSEPGTKFINFVWDTYSKDMIKKIFTTNLVAIFYKIKEHLDIENLIMDDFIINFIFDRLPQNLISHSMGVLDNFFTFIRSKILNYDIDNYFDIELADLQIKGQVSYIDSIRDEIYSIQDIEDDFINSIQKGLDIFSIPYKFNFNLPEYKAETHYDKKQIKEIYGSLNNFLNKISYLTLENNGQHYPLSAVGSGIKRILKILLISWANRFDTIFLEEPEQNLHPNYQSKLADLFQYIIKKNYQRLLIESHSEYLIRRLQYLIATKKMKKEDVVIYYFGNDPTQPGHIKEITIDDYGRLSQDFGEGFFDEGAKLISDIWGIEREN